MFYTAFSFFIPYINHWHYIINLIFCIHAEEYVYEGRNYLSCSHLQHQFLEKYLKSSKQSYCKRIGQVRLLGSGQGTPEAALEAAFLHKMKGVAGSVRGSVNGNHKWNCITIFPHPRASVNKSNWAEWTSMHCPHWADHDTAYKQCLYELLGIRRPVLGQDVHAPVCDCKTSTPFHKRASRRGANTGGWQTWQTLAHIGWKAGWSIVQEFLDRGFKTKCTQSGWGTEHCGTLWNVGPYPQILPCPASMVCCRSTCKNTYLVSSRLVGKYNPVTAYAQSGKFLGFRSVSSVGYQESTDGEPLA